MKPLQPIGAVLRAVFATSLVGKSDRRMREAIGRLNAVSDATIAETRVDRATALDDVATAR